jgi:hypothetical protein
MAEPDVLEWTTVREVTGALPSHAMADATVDDLLLSGFDRADIDILAVGEPLRKQIGDDPGAALEIANVPDPPGQPFTAPEDVAGIYATLIGVVGGLCALMGALGAIAAGWRTVPTFIAALVAGAIGCATAAMIAWWLGWRWPEPSSPAEGDPTVLWVHVSTPESEQKALRILESHGATGVRVHEVKLEKRVEHLPLGRLRPDPLLGNERLAQP